MRCHGLVVKGLIQEIYGLKSKALFFGSNLHCHLQNRFLDSIHSIGVLDHISELDHMLVNEWVYDSNEMGRLGSWMRSWRKMGTILLYAEPKRQ